MVIGGLMGVIVIQMMGECVLHRAGSVLAAGIAGTLYAENSGVLASDQPECGSPTSIGGIWRSTCWPLAGWRWSSLGGREPLRLR